MHTLNHCTSLGFRGLCPFVYVCSCWGAVPLIPPERPFQPVFPQQSSSSERSHLHVLCVCSISLGPQTPDILSWLLAILVRCQSLFILGFERHGILPAAHAFSTDSSLQIFQYCLFFFHLLLIFWTFQCLKASSPAAYQGHTRREKVLTQPSHGSKLLRKVS